MLSLTPRDLATARQLIESRVGLEIPKERAHEITTAVRQRARASDAHGVEGYLAQLTACPEDGELDRLSEALAVHETYFFRDPDQLDEIVDHALPDRARAKPRVRVLSAGSSTGAEAYSIAILLRERRPDLAARTEIRGVDLSHSAIESARRGRYLPWALRTASPAMTRRWFHPRGRAHEISAELRAAVSFDVKNLLGDAEIAAPGAFDVILCRNVIMYLSRRAAQVLVARLERSIAPGGYLFLGHAETLRGFDTALELDRRAGICTSYRRDADGARPDASPARPRSTDHSVRRAPPARRATAPRRGRDEGERSALVRRAIELVDNGDLARAEEACARAAEADETDAGPRYLTALCRDRAGDLEGAIRHHTAAAYLDPTFAMPCLHLALLGRRAGDERATRREMERAMLLVEREDEARLALFGGGLDREAWLRICAAELSRAERSR